MTAQLRVFVASSSERITTAIDVAKRLTAAGKTVSGLPRVIDAVPWTNDTFSFSRTYIESLERELDRADFAVVIYTGDDFAKVRQEEVNLPRDNVIFELGLFIGRLNRERCFFFVDRAAETRIASDLSGVKEVSFTTDCKAVAGQPSSLARACRSVVTQMLEVGERFKPGSDTRARQQEAWHFVRAASGYWWSFQHWERDGIGFVTLDPNLAGPTLTVRGAAFSPSLPACPTAQWRSTTSFLTGNGTEWSLDFNWEGTVPGRQRFSGTSRYLFFTAPTPTPTPREGRGEIVETNMADYASTYKEAELRRCDNDDARVMLETDNEARRFVLEKQLSHWKGW